MNFNSTKKSQIILVLLVIWISIVSRDAYADVKSVEDIYLQSVPTVLPPEIQGNKIKYTMFFVFDKCPEEQWAFFDQEKSNLTIEFYGVHLDESFQIVLKGIPVVKNAKILNLETLMSISGVRAQIILDMEGFWHYEYMQISEKVLQLQIWNYLDPVAVLKSDKYKARTPLLITLVCVSTAILTVVLLTLLNKPD